MTSTGRAIEKIAEPEHARDRRAIVCHRCGAETVVARSAALEETGCIRCVRRLSVPPRVDRDPPRALRFVSGWCDKARVPGPGYGIVECPHCAVRCVVEVGATARTGCAACLRPLGPRPLLRMDLKTGDLAATARDRNPDRARDGGADAWRDAGDERRADVGACRAGAELQLGHTV